LRRDGAKRAKKSDLSVFSVPSVFKFRDRRIEITICSVRLNGWFPDPEKEEEKEEGERGRIDYDHD
jgi:hypothetical protein